MTRQETAIIMDILTTAYPRFYSGNDAPDPKKTLSLWATMFAEEPVALVAAAVKTFIATDNKGYPPHIGAIKNAIYSLKTEKDLDEVEAWNLVRKAIANSSYESQEEFQKLPENVRRIVGSPNQLRDWSQMDSEVINSVVSSNFQRAFRARSESGRKTALMPPDVRKTIGSLVGNSLYLESGRQDDF